jgi:hypothetical protein
LTTTYNAEIAEIAECSLFENENSVISAISAFIVMSEELL